MNESNIFSAETMNHSSMLNICEGIYKKTHTVARGLCGSKMLEVRKRLQGGVANNFKEVFNSPFAQVTFVTIANRNCA